MSDDLRTMCRAMDGRWEVTSITTDGNRQTVTYHSLDIPGVKWTMQPFHPELTPRVGDRGRIGFITTQPAEAT